jgi:hypothetical protein
MARIRTTKPEFWTDSKTGTLSSDAKCVFIALWNHVDDYGVIENDPVEIAARILPHRTTALDDCLLRPLDEIARKRLIEPFVIDGKAYLWVRNFTKHQRIKNPAKPLLPDFDKHLTPTRYIKATGALPEPSGTPTGALPEDPILPQPSPSPIPKVQGIGRDRKGKDRKGKEGIGGEGRGSVKTRPDPSSHSAPPATATAIAGDATAKTPKPGDPDYDDSEPVLGRNFTSAETRAERGIPDPYTAADPKRPNGNYVPPPPDEIESKRLRMRAQLEARMSPEERAEAERIRLEKAGASS